jgi:hypothetical protein
MKDSDQAKGFVLIESEGLLYRGPSADHPQEVWDYPRRRWVPYMDAGPQKDSWGKPINAEQAERLKSNNSSAEHFMYYDEPPWLQPTSQAYWNRVLPDHIKKALAEAAAKKDPKLKG